MVVPNTPLYPDISPTAPAIYLRSYCRRTKEGKRETWEDTNARTVKAITDIGKLTLEEKELLLDMQGSFKTLTSGRWLWVGGTEWIKNPKNFYGAYNCSSLNITSIESFGLLVNLAMQGCGTGAVLEPEYINQLPTIYNELEVNVVDQIGEKPVSQRCADTLIYTSMTHTVIDVGDSRQGWVDAYLAVINCAISPSDGKKRNVDVHLHNVRPAGEPLKGFGGVSNPIKLPFLFNKVADILNGALGRKLNSVECTLLLDEAALVVVAGSIRRSAGIKQGSSEDKLFATAKDNLWSKGKDGKWSIDPKRDALRMSNHTRVFHHKPTLEECIESVRSQYYSGEGAIQWAGEAIARANADLLDEPDKKLSFLKKYNYAAEMGKGYLDGLYMGANNFNPMPQKELTHRMQRYAANPCFEIIGSDFLCNLADIHLNLIDPLDQQEQIKAFTAGGLAVASLLHHQFIHERFQYSREIDPIVGVSFTGLFDFFVKLFGTKWLRWWEQGRPETLIGIDFKQQEQNYLTRWKDVVHKTVWGYCDRHNLTRPNRCTVVQPSGSKSLLTGASPGWHPPKASRYIRRITFERENPIALALRDYGYQVIPSSDDKNEQGQLLDDPFDSRCTSWLVEFPISMPWADIQGVDDIDISKFSALAQMDFYMQVQKYYTAQNTSSTIELTENEIVPLATKIFELIQNDEGYISTALLARSNAPFPRLPFEKITKEQYEDHINAVIRRRKSDNLPELLALYDTAIEQGVMDSACSGGTCETRYSIPLG